MYRKILSCLFNQKILIFLIFLCEELACGTRLSNNNTHFHVEIRQHIYPDSLLSKNRILKT